MCGIVGYIGDEININFIIDLLSKIEYRGYDSAGIGYLSNSILNIIKSVGDVSILKGLVDLSINSRVYIAHTRWATHGKVSYKNTHPHVDSSKKVFIVHNGIIDNHNKIRRDYLKDIKYYSDTDSEIIPNLIKVLLDEYDGDLLNVCKRIYQICEGSYTFIGYSIDNPDTLFTLSNDLPLVLSDIGTGYLYGSDPILYGSDSKYYRINNGISIINSNKVQMFTTSGNKLSLPVLSKSNNFIISKLNYKSFFEKEIYDQGINDGNTIDSYIKIIKNILNEINKKYSLNKDIRILLCASGSAYNAALLISYYFTEISNIYAQAFISSELNDTYIDLIKPSLSIVISQSGETLDALMAMRILKNNKIPIITICNSIDSTLVSLSEFNIDMKVGPEVSVAATKSFLSQILIGYLLVLTTAVFISNIDSKLYRSYLNRLKIDILSISKLIEKSLLLDNFKIKNSTIGTIILGKGYTYSIAKEISLKLKEVCYLQSEGLISSEIKHGSLALLSSKILTILLINSVEVFNALREVVSRSDNVFIIARDGFEVSKYSNNYLIIESSVETFPILSIVPLQILAMKYGYEHSLPIDKPRNLAKSVTVK